MSHSQDEDCRVERRHHGHALTTWQALAGFAFVVFAFLMLGWRVQVNTRVIHQSAYDNCLAQTSRVEQLNNTARGFIAIEENNHVAAPETTAQRLKLYRGSILPLPQCGKRP